MAKLNGWVKIGLVFGGYVGAALLASAAVYVNDWMTPPDVLAASAGMSAFGDLLLFIGVCGVTALVPTGLGLYFLWAHGRKRQSESKNKIRPKVMEL